jgi:hypothetical protein
MRRAVSFWRCSLKSEYCGLGLHRLVVMCCVIMRLSLHNCSQRSSSSSSKAAHGAIRAERDIRGGTE